VSLFPLTEKVIEVRGQSLTIREWTPAQRSEFGRRKAEDPEAALFHMIASCVVSPAINAEDLAEYPVAVVDQLLSAILALNGLGVEVDEKND